MSLEYAIGCDGCGALLDSSKVSAAAARKVVREELGGRTNLPGGKDLCGACVAAAHEKIRPYFRSQAWVLHPHYPVCRDCGEPWPCRELEITREVRKQAEEVDRLAAILPGCCWECGEPVTSRQKAVRFDGENLLLPGSPPPVFHLRVRSAGGQYCLSAAVGYEEKWVAAAPGRRWRLSCPGNVIRHVDGRECSELVDCPGEGARHHGDVMSHRFTGTADGEVVPVLGSGAEDCRRCLDVVDAGFYAREQAEYLARKNGCLGAGEAGIGGRPGENE